MGQKFCIFCGEALLEDANFCSNCGEPVEPEDAPVEQDLPTFQDIPKVTAVSPLGKPKTAPVEQDAPPSPDLSETIRVSPPGKPKNAPVGQDSPASPDIPEATRVSPISKPKDAPVGQDAPASQAKPEATLVSPHEKPEGAPVPAAGDATKFPVKFITGIVIVLVITTAAVFVVLPKLSGSTSLIASQKSTEPVTPIPEALTTPVVSTPVENPFPNALALRQKIMFGSGDTISEGTVYRYWMNDTYHWHNDKDNHYYVQKPAAGYKFLVIFLDVVNKGDKRVWPPTAGSIHLIYDGTEYALDNSHYLPDKSVKVTPIEIEEIQYISKLTGTEYVEDYGYSHGATLSFLFPGAGNAIDGYLIYEVPESLTPDKTFVKIEFNWQDTAVWKLA